MAFTEYYVDPAGGNDTTGDGSIGTPWATVQKALNTITRDATNGDRINVKAGTADTLSATLSAATYGSPTVNAPLVFQGYSTSAGDGGIGEISGAGSYSVWNDTARDGVIFADLHLHSSGSNTIVRGDDDCAVIRCEIDNTTGNGVEFDNRGIIAGCHIHNCGADGAKVNFTNGTFVGNAFFDGTNTFSNAIYTGGASCMARRNIIYLTGNGTGIYCEGNYNNISHNSVLSSGGTGKGISFNGNRSQTVVNNVAEGFSGTGGCGFDFGFADDPIVMAGNAAYNNTTNYDTPTYSVWEDDNETLGSTPFAKSGAATYANRMTYFAPADVGGMRSGAFPEDGVLSKGAVQYVAAGGGGGSSLYQAIRGRRSTIGI